MSPSEMEKVSSSLPDRPIRVIGIDLGTTNSVVAEILWSPGQKGQPRARCLEIDQETQEGMYTNVLLPSVIALLDGKEWVGEGARRLRTRSSQIGLRRNTSLFFECKNEIGLRKTYGTAPDGFGDATEIASRVLGRIWQEILAQGPTPTRVVVTVPASFQSTQRQETKRAASLAKIELHTSDLLDEPIAAFLDYVAQNDARSLQASPGQRLLVFDFGGGTCDVALFKLENSTASDPSLSPVGVSRYHRIGGADIDAAIVHQILIPQLIEQNGLNPLDLSFEDKKDVLEPTLLGVAESLKIGLCREIRRAESSDSTTAVNNLVKRQPGRYECVLESGVVSLQSPTMSMAQFSDVVAPFIDPDLLYPSETEYMTVSSVFRPIQDALDRAGWSQETLNFVLLTGGSSLIPQVQEAVSRYFPSAKILTHNRPEAWQTTVACGAAYHALSLALYGRPMFGVVAQDVISIRSGSGLLTLIDRSTALPFPADGSFATNETLGVPSGTITGACDLRVELVAGESTTQQVLFSALWKIPGPIERGEALRVEYRLSESQLLDLRVSLASDPARTPLEARIENPLSHVVNPHSTRLQVAEIEERLNSGAIRGDAAPAVLEQLSELHAELGQRDRAISDLRRAIAANGRPDANLLNKLASAYGQAGDVAREERYFREAIKDSGWAGSCFNLALSQWRRDKLSDAIANVEQAIGRERKAPYLVLRGVLADDLGQTEERDIFLGEAYSLFGDAPQSLSEFELGWYVTAALRQPDAKRLSAGRAEQQRRAQNRVSRSGADGMLPEIRPALARSGS